jgi:hypothetical protein
MLYKKEDLTYVSNRKIMKNFYYNIWLPFTVTKRRILLLAIASYIALC